MPWWLAVGIAALDLGPALFALPWLYAAMGGIPFAAPWPPGYLIVAAIAGFTALVDVAVWRAVMRIMRNAQG